MTEDDRRAKIVAAARVAMNQFGVRRMTVADVALEAGVSRQTVYEYFPGRDALVEAAMEAAGRDLVSEAERRTSDTASPVDSLAALLEVVLAYFADSPLWAVEAKRVEFLPHVAGGGSTFAAAAVATMRTFIARRWPAADAPTVHRTADTLVRTLISHGLAPEDTPAQDLAAELAALAAARLDG